MLFCIILRKVYAVSYTHLVAHRLNTIVGADQIMVLGHGKIESIGTHKELIQNSSAYQKLWQSYSGKEVVE